MRACVPATARRGLTPPDPGAADAPLGGRTTLPNPPGAISRNKARAAPLDTPGRVVVRHSPCTPLACPDSLGLSFRTPPKPPAPRKDVPHIFPNPSRLAHPAGSRGGPLDALHYCAEQSRCGEAGQTLSPCARLLTRTTEGSGREVGKTGRRVGYPPYRSQQCSIRSRPISR